MPAKSKKYRKKEIGIIGYGRFGRLAAHHLKRRFTVYVFDKRQPNRTERGIKFSTLQSLMAKEIIILAVPINCMKSLLKTISSRIQPGTILIDLCSVKEQPVKWMKEYIPKHIKILGTHPLFGPDSAGTNLKGRSIVLCPVNIPNSDLKAIIKFLRSFGLTIHLLSPEDHDRLMASTLFITQFIGRAAFGVLPVDSCVTTPNFKRLIAIARSSQSDSIDLFRDMYRYNRFARTIPLKIIRNFEKLSTVLLESYRHLHKKQT